MIFLRILYVLTLPVTFLLAFFLHIPAYGVYWALKGREPDRGPAWFLEWWITDVPHTLAGRSL